MPVEFSEMEQSIIKNMMLRKSYKDITNMLDCSVEDIAAFVTEEIADTNTITWQMKLDEKRPVRKSPSPRKPPAEKPIPKDNKVAEAKKLAFELREQKRANLAERMNIERQRSVQRRQPAYKTIERDYSKMILVRIDRQTQIYVKLGEDIEAAKEKYQLQVEKSKAAYLANDVKPERYKTVKKKCVRCEQDKKIDDFNGSRTNKDGKNGMCKLCESNVNKIRAAEKIENSRF